MKKDFQLIQVFDDPSRGFRGNISSVVLLDQLLEMEIMQRMASDLAQPATTFLAPMGSNSEYEVRWFAPDGEIGLCGHGSMAAMAFLNQRAPGMEYTLYYKNGKLSGKAEIDNKVQINLKAIPALEKLPVDEALKEGLGISILEYWHTENKDIVLVNSEESLLNMKPSFNKLRDRDAFGYAVTAKGDKIDFVSRTLVPHVGQLEDHATGSSHAMLVPFWAERLEKTKLDADQLSPRKGKFSCAYNPDRRMVKLTGHYSIIAKGAILI